MQPQGQPKGCDNPLQAFISDSFRLVAETRQQVDMVSESARQAVKAFYHNPADLAAFIERHGTPVVRLPGGPAGHFCSLAVFLLGFEPGFIAPVRSGPQKKRFDRLTRFLKLVGNIPPHCRFDSGVFVLMPPLFTTGFMAHQLHHWMACKSGLTGYSEQAQQLYKKFWNEQGGLIGHEVYDMSYEEILSLKQAINRDLEALQFLREIASEILGPARQGCRFKKGGLASA